MRAVANCWGMIIGILAACGCNASSSGTGSTGAAGGASSTTSTTPTTTNASTGQGTGPTGGGGGSTSGTHATPMPLISRDLPIYASYEQAPAGGANDAHYNSFWQSGHVPSLADSDWIAIDLSSVAVEKRSAVYALWFNEGSYAYDTETLSYSLPGDYRYEANSAPGGGAPPASGWVVLNSVGGNHFSSGAHLLSLAGANWLRLVCTAGAMNTPAGSQDTLLQWEIYDAHAGVDGWKFAGDSITANAIRHEIFDDSVNQLLENEGKPFPPFEMAAHGGWATDNLLPVMDEYIANFPGRYFSIAFGTNEVGMVDPAKYTANMTVLIDKVLAAGKVPVVPTIAYTGAPGYLDGIQILNGEIQKLYTKYGDKLVHGPDLYKLFYDGRATMFDDPSYLHPNAVGGAAQRQAWADVIASLY